MLRVGLGGCFVSILSFNLPSVSIRSVANGTKSVFVKSVDDIEVGRPGTVLEEWVTI